MKRLLSAGMVLAFLCASVGVLRADVKTREKDQLKFEGMLGRLAGMFGGSAAKEGVISSVAVVGDRKMSLNDSTGEIIDLAEEKVYRLDVRRKTYTVVTFADLRRQMEEAQAKAQKEMKETEERPAPADAPEMEVDFDVKETGQRKSVAGHDTRQVVATITVRQKGMTLEDGGGMVMTSDMWMADSIPALAEIGEFDMKFFQKVYGSTIGTTAQQMAAAMAMYPGLQAAMKRMQEEGRKMDGTPLITTMSVDAVKSKAEMAEAGGGGGEGGGVSGMLARRMMRRKTEEPRSKIMTSINEVLSIATSASAADVALPEGYKEKE